MEYLSPLNCRFGRTKWNPTKFHKCWVLCLNPTYID